MRLLCITVNYRTTDLTLALLRALQDALAGLDASVVVVDNGSDDGSADRLRGAIDTIPGDVPVRLMCSRTNLGFGGGNNLAIRAALSQAEPPDVIHLINPDAVPEPQAMIAMLEFLEAHPDAGIAGSAVIDGTGERHCSAFRFPSPLGDLEGRLRLGIASRLLDRWRIPMEPGNEAQEVDWVSGSTCSLRRTMLEEVGLFDEDFFLYYEETDLCRRARAAGFQVWTVPASVVHHIGAVTTGLDDLTRRRPAFWFESRRLYLRKHHGRFGLWLADLAWLFGSMAFGLRRMLSRRPPVDPPGLVADFLRHGLGLASGLETRN